MRFYYNFEYDKLKLKEVVLLVPKNHPNLASMLTPALALYGITMKDFMDVFEKITSHLEYDLVVPVTLVITKIKTFQLSLKTVALNNLLHIYRLFDKQKWSSDVLFMYKLLLLKSIRFGVFLKPTRILYKNLKNYLAFFFLANRTKRRVINAITIKQPNIHVAPFGISFSFFTANCSYLTYLKMSAFLFNVNLAKLTNSFFLSSTLRGVNFLLSSFRLTNFLAFLKNGAIITTKAVGFKPLFVNWGQNVMSVDFFKNELFIQTFKKDIKSLIFSFCFLLKRVSVLYKRLNVNIIKLYHAHVSTTVKNSKA